MFRACGGDRPQTVAAVVLTALFFVSETLSAASPITYADKDDPPMLTLHGAKDPLVPPDQAERFDKTMKEAGASHTLMLLEEQRHGFRGEAALTASKAMYDFFDKHLKPGE